MRSLALLILFILAIATLARAEKQQNKKSNDEEESNGIDDELGDGVKPTNSQEQQIDLSNGFGTDIDWVGWSDAISIALDLNKPIFLLIHKTWCGACSALKKSFNTSNKRAELVELSKRFVMVNLEDDDEPEEEIYAPDGRYIPRLFILDKKGEPLAVDNKKNYPNNQQYFPQVPDVIKAMKKGLEIFEGGEGKKEEDSPKGPKEPKKVTKKGKEEVEAKKEKEDPKAGGCPHAAGKAAKKAAEEAAKNKGEKTGKGENKANTEEKSGKKKKEEKNEKKANEQKQKTKKKKEEAKEEL